MRDRKRAFCILIFLCSWLRVNSQVIYDAPPLGVSLTRPILPWLARYFVGAGKSNMFMDSPQTSATDPSAKGIHQLYNTPMANYVPKPGVRRQEASEDTKPDADGDKPDEETTEAPKEEAPVEEAKPEEEKKEEPEETTPAPEEAKPETEPATLAPPEDTSEVAKIDTTDAPPQKDPVPNTQQPPPFIVPSVVPGQVPTNYWPFGPLPNNKPIQGLPVAPPISAPCYNAPYIYYPAPLPAYPSAYPYPSPIVSHPTVAIPTTVQPPVLVTATFPSLPAPKPVILEPVTPKNWPQLPEPIPITSITLPPVTTIQPIAALPAPKPVVPIGVPSFSHVPFFSMPAHSIIPFQSVAPPGSYLGQPYMSAVAPCVSSSLVSPKYFYRDIGNVKPPESRRHQVYLQTQPIYKINQKRQ